MATWMLKHFGSGPNNDVILGDLAEQYVQKNSVSWYWRQAMKAIPVSLFREIRAHQGIAARALLTGWVTWILCGSLIFPAVFFGTNMGVAVSWGHPIGSLWSFMWMPVLGTYTARPFYPLVFAAAITLPLLVGAMCGWLVSRIYRDQQASVVLLFAGSIFLTDLLLFGSFVLTVGTPVAYLLAGPLAANVAASILGILLGSGLLRDHRRTAS